MDNGIALLTEDRKGSGIFPVLGVGENTYIAVYKRLARFLGLINGRRCNELAEESIERLSIKTPSIRTPMNSLSGGNQQKVLFARWLLTEPEVLLLDEPTRGIDVGAKYEIYTIMADLAAQGKCVVMISSEMPELIGMADRVMVMCEGQKGPVNLRATRSMKRRSCALPPNLWFRKEAGIWMQRTKLPKN